MHRKRSLPILRFAVRLVAVFTAVLATVILFAMAVQLYENTRLEIASRAAAYRLPAPKSLQRFTILDPYAREGRYYRVQLHVHSKGSAEPGGLPPEAVVASYRRDGYDAIFLTDHDRITPTRGLGSASFLVIPGLEDTVAFGTWPLGRHLLRLGVRAKTGGRSAAEKIAATVRAGGIAAPAHLNWRGNLGTGRWLPPELLALRDYELIEIFNPHSNDPRDLTLWHLVMARNGPAHPVWGIAVDDAHHGSNQQGWVFVKAARLEEGAIVSALRRGCFYATAGPEARFGVRDGVVLASAEHADWIRFVDLQQRVVAAVRGNSASYRPAGDEGAVRVEVEFQGKTAYSQPFWLVEERTGDGKHPR